MKIIIIITLLSLFITTGCSSKDKNAAEILDTARFEEKQNNFEHASKLYSEVMRNFPDSESANIAKMRLEELKKRKP